MKNYTYSAFILLSLFLACAINSSAQTTIWSEDFSTYADNTGIEGPGTVNIGDYPAGVTKWTLDVSGCTLSNADDYMKTDNEKLKSQDLDGPAIWLSASIDLSAYSNGASFSIKFYEYSSMEADDYIDVFYQLNGGDFVLIPNWNGHGSGIHTLIDDFSKDTVVQSVNACNNLVIKVVFDNDSGFEDFQMDDVFVYPNMEYVSSTITQNTHNIAAGKTNQQVIGMEIITTETESPLSITQFTINANGSSTPIATNIENAKIYYTGTSNVFATDTQFGSTYASPTTTNFDITDTQELSEGTNYFWLTFDTKTGATLGELIDAECTSFIIDGSSETATITAPAGNRTISAPLSGNYTIGAKSNYASFTAAANDLNSLGISSAVSFAVASGTYTEQISLSAIEGTSTTNTIVFQSVTNDPADVILQFTPTSTANYVLSFDGSDHISFLDMTIQTTGTSSYGRVFVLSGAMEGITLKGNNITGFDISSDDDAYAVIYASSGANNMASNINIENNTITNGSHGIYFRGDNDTNLETQNTFINNILNNFYHTGINVECQDAVIINKNTLSSKTSNASANGIVANECNNAMEITQNKVLLYASSENIGISLYTCIGSSVNIGLTANNYISFETATTTTEGIYLMSCGYQKIYHNSINIRASEKNTGGNKTGTNIGLGVDHWWADEDYGHLDIRNNVAYTEDISGICLSQTTVDENYVETCNNNVWWVVGEDFGDYGDETCSTYTDWQAASGLDANSDWENPEYVSDEIPDITNEALGESVSKLPEVSKDIRGSRRADNTTPGATILTNRWLGNSHLWDDPNNWSLGVVPNDSHDVVIVGGYNSGIDKPILDMHVDCHSLNLESGTLALNGHTINVCGNLIIGDGNAYGGVINLNGEDSQFQFLDTKDPWSRFKLDDVDLRFYDESTSKATADIEVKSITTKTGSTMHLDGHDCVITEGLDLAEGSWDDPGKTTFSGTANSQVTTGGNILDKVVVDKDGNAVVDLQDALVAAALEVRKGKLNVSSHVEVDDLTIGGTGSSSVVQVEPGKGIISNDSIIIKSGGELIVKSDEDDEGYVIPKRIIKEGTGKIIIERYVTNGKWHLVSSPVDNATVNSLYFDSNPNVWVRKYNEVDDTWTNITDLSTPMPFGKGFGYWVETPSDVTTMFTGDLLTDNLTLNNSSTPPLEFTNGDRGYNLVGNPYSCALDWDIGTWERTNLEGSVWVWLDAGTGDGSGNYLVRNLAGEGSLTEGIIPMCQGFFVRATAANPVLTIPNDARVSSSQSYYKKTGEEIAPHLILSVTNNGNQDEVWIGFDENMTTSFDYGRDVNKLFGSANSPQLFIKEQSLQLSVDILPKLISNEERAVAMGFIANSNDTYVIAAASLENIPETNIVLEDLKTGILHDLKTNPEYSFSASTQDDANRFLIHFYYSANGIINPDGSASNSGINIYSYNKAIYIKCNDKMAKQTGNISIYDLYGKLLISKEFKSGNLHKIDVPLHHSCVVVRVLKADIITTTKVFL